MTSRICPNSETISVRAAPARSSRPAVLTLVSGRGIRHHDLLRVRSVDQGAHPARAAGHQRIDPLGQIRPVHRGQVVAATVPRQHHLGVGLDGQAEEFIDQFDCQRTACRRRRRRRTGRPPPPRHAVHVRSPAAARPRSSSRRMGACSAGNGCPGAAITKTGRSAGRRCRPRARPAWSVRAPDTARVALSRPMRRDSPPASTTPASERHCSFVRHVRRHFSPRSRCRARAAAIAARRCRTRSHS